MTRRWLLGVAAALMALPALARPMQWPDLLNRPQPKPDATIAYGADPLQHVELWLPQSRGRHPVVLMIHGGCWQTEIAKADIMNWIADDLRKRGIAVWNVEYRGIDRPGGGYPGTFRDTAQAADALAANAAKYRLRLDHVVAVGHSAGGHLALWLAARGALPKTSPLYAPHPLKLTAAIGLGALPDLEAGTIPPGNTCDNDPVPRLVGTPSPARRDVYYDTSPARLPNPNIPIFLVNGTVDHIAPPDFAAAYAAKHRVRRITIADEGHVELITPDTKAWAETVKLIEDAFR
ncbi:MAG TPA: alpha/beta hydrolase [Sphingomonas sp.]|uniref:alpha/beta hydrolase family protein n=1 Tax=Sphingomonas sp. TaxID=28214 RepID=UPI002C80F65C|nr:alpha/beta hydrolase [Sphingomonas sp.]HMI20887.1 alpha/beta hydrolase [Sphingomonas sp.]